MLKILCSFDDGVEQDFRMKALLEKYNICGIFFIPTATTLSESQIKELANNPDLIKIGGHTVSHPEDLKLLSPDEQFGEISENRNWLIELTSQELEWFAYPSGRYDPNITCKLVEKAGFKYARTTLVGSLAGPHYEPYRVKTTVQVGNNNRKEYGGKDWAEYLRGKINISPNYPEGIGTLHIWGHCEQLNEGDWLALETIFSEIKNLNIPNFITK